MVASQLDCGEYNKLLPLDEDSPMQGVSSTRELLERSFRRRMLALPNVSLHACTLPLVE